MSSPELLEAYHDRETWSHKLSLWRLGVGIFPINQKWRKSEYTDTAEDLRERVALLFYWKAPEVIWGVNLDAVTNFARWHYKIDLMRAIYMWVNGNKRKQISKYLAKDATEVIQDYFVNNRYSSWDDSFDLSDQGLLFLCGTREDVGNKLLSIRWVWEDKKSKFMNFLDSISWSFIEE